jgi:NAD(P)-dependent dehydrogenase (short-subunit alcohol dehydrogenase family)
VNNAGTAIPKRFEETTLEELDRLIDINVRGTFVATQAALKQMKSGGCIIMIGSCVGERAMTPGLVPYSATKGAVKMFTQGLSREVGSRGARKANAVDTPGHLRAEGLGNFVASISEKSPDEVLPLLPIEAADFSQSPGWGTAITAVRFFRHYCTSPGRFQSL